MDKYIYEGPVWVNGYNRGIFELETRAKSLVKAKSNFVKQISDILNIPVNSDIVIKEEYIVLDNDETYFPKDYYKNKCPKCGRELDTSGMCPKCDLGDEEA